MLTLLATPTAAKRYLLFSLVTGQALDEFVTSLWGLFVTLLPAIKALRSGRAECAGMGSRRKQKKKKSLWRFTSDQSDRLAWKPAARFVSAFDVGGCAKLKLQIAPHTQTLAGCVLPRVSPAPVRPMISAGARVYGSVNEQSPPILLWVMKNVEEYWSDARTWGREGGGMTTANSTKVSHTYNLSKQKRSVCEQSPSPPYVALMGVLQGVLHKLRITLI